jgi:hypothetical protein
MKTLVRSMVLAGGLSLVAGVAPARAQVYEPVSFTTTFPFMVGQKTLPAGTYTVRPANEEDGSLLEVQGRQDSAIFFGENAARPRNNPNETAVVFDRTGDRYVLAQIWDGADQEGAEAIPAKGSSAATADRRHARK